jgi:hypothetical protein
MQVPEPQFLGTSLTLKKYVSPIHLTLATYANSPPGIFSQKTKKKVFTIIFSFLPLIACRESTVIGRIFTLFRSRKGKRKD